MCLQHGSDLMAMCVTASEAQVIQEESDLAMVQRTRRAAEMLSAKDDGQ